MKPRLFTILLLAVLPVALCGGSLIAWQWFRPDIPPEIRMERNRLSPMLIKAYDRAFARLKNLPEKQRKYIEAIQDQRSIYTNDYLGLHPDVERAKQSLRTNPRDAKALRTLAEHATSVTHRYNEAIRWLKQAKQVDPANDFYEGTLGDLYRFVGDNAKARTAFEACAARGGYYGKSCALGLEDMKRHPNLRQSDCADCDRP